MLDAPAMARPTAATTSAQNTVAALPPLYVDLDGTFLRTDTLLECVCRYIFPRLYRLFLLPLLLLKGRAHFKQVLAQSTTLAVETLPVREDLLAYLEAQSATGRSITLATAADASIARQICVAYPIFESFIASSGGVNLKGAAKRDAIAAHAGGAFSYAGDSSADVPIFEASASVIYAGGAARYRDTFQGVKVERVFDNRPVSKLKTMLKAIRLHQWVKNVLLFMPLLPLGMSITVDQLLHTVVGIVCFGLIASSIYIANDLSDLEADRRHSRKRLRPFASGARPITAGLLLSPALLIAGLALALVFVGWIFTVVLVCYAIVSTMYTTMLKRKPVMDVITLAGLYSMRILAGAAAIQVTPSFWILGFSMFFFLSLASVKRYSELDTESDASSMKSSRGYVHSDQMYVVTSGMASAYCAVLVFGLYIAEVTQAGRFAFPFPLWGCCLLLLMWISRTWFKTLRGEMHSDPVVFATRDLYSQITGLLFILAFAATAFTRA